MLIEVHIYPDIDFSKILALDLTFFNLKNGEEAAWEKEKTKGQTIRVPLAKKMAWGPLVKDLGLLSSICVYTDFKYI